MEMTFGTAHDIWNRVINGDKTLTEAEVKDALKWFDDFSGKLSEKASQSEHELQRAIQKQEEKAIIERKRKATESDKRQEEDSVRKYDDLMNWLNAQV